MTLTLVRKLLRDVRLPLAVIALLLGGFQILWIRITARVLGQISPYITAVASFAGESAKDIEKHLFEGPGQLARSLIGGENIDLQRATDMASIGYVHPLVQTIFCIWAIGRASGAIAGEIDRGTMELLLAQPLARFRLVLGHLCVDAITIPVLALSLWLGTCLGTAIVGEITPEQPDLTPPKELPAAARLLPLKPESPEQQRERLAIHPRKFLAALPMVCGLLFALSGFTMWLSAAGRFRWRVLGLAVLVALLQFLINLLGQMWDPIAPLRPLTVFYYYQPQQAILGGGWLVTVNEWHSGVRVPGLLVLYGVGALGYALALWTFTRRDLPAPL